MSTYEIEHEVEFEGTDEDGEETVTVVNLMVKVEVSGRHYPATWGYDGGSPEEFPEAEIVSIAWQPTGSGPWVEVPTCFDPLSKFDIESIEAHALKQHEDYDPREEYADRDDDFDDRDYAY
jgi:hypothetical protein